MAHDLYQSQPRSRRRTAANWPVFWGLIALIIALPLLWVYLDPTPSGDGSPARTVVVRPGEGWTETSSRLREQGIIRRPLVFKAIVLLSGGRSQLLPGRYQLRRGTSSRDLISAMTNQDNQAVVIVPEGFRLEQIGERMVAQGLATPEQWRDALKSPPEAALLRSRPPGVGLEGYLYPDSYAFTEENAARQMVAEATSNLQERLTADLRSGFTAQGLSVHEALTLASIVEREAQAPAERPVIASVYLNRLKAGMPLQADPTVQYAVGRPGSWWKPHLTRADLHDPSPYNTYVHNGLPPGPIAGPGIASIQAVAHPASTRYLYFVARGDGSHAFAETLEEHNLNVQRYLRP